MKRPKTIRPGRFVQVEDGEHVIHKMRVTSVDSKGGTVTGDIAVYPTRKHHPVLQEITIHKSQVVEI